MAHTPDGHTDAAAREGPFIAAPTVLFTQPGMLGKWVKVVAAVTLFALALTEIFSMLILGPEEGEWGLAVAGLVLLPLLGLIACVSTW